MDKIRTPVELRPKDEPFEWNGAMDRDHLEHGISERTFILRQVVKEILDEISSAGLGVVPVEPTSEMSGAAFDEFIACGSSIVKGNKPAIRAAIKKGNLL